MTPLKPGIYLYRVYFRYDEKPNELTSEDVPAKDRNDAIRVFEDKHTGVEVRGVKPMMTDEEPWGETDD